MPIAPSRLSVIRSTRVASVETNTRQPLLSPQEAIRDSPAADQRLFPLLLSIGKAHPGQDNIFADGVGQAQTQRVTAIFAAPGDAALTPGGFILRAQNEELIRAGFGPGLLPFGVAGETGFSQVKLSVKQLLRAEAHADTTCFAVGFQLLQTQFQSRQAPSLLMPWVRARDALLQLGHGSLRLPDLDPQVVDLPGEQFPEGFDLALQLDAHRVELARGDAPAHQVVGF